jgi:hypothetical protein
MYAHKLAQESARPTRGVQCKLCHECRATAEVQSLDTRHPVSAGQLGAKRRFSRRFRVA